MKTIYFFYILILLSRLVFAEVPHILQNGDVIDAKQLNENFKYLEKNKYKVKANGVVIGSTPNYGYGYIFLVINENFSGVAFYNNGRVSAKASAFFKGTDCVGTPYVILGIYSSGYNFPPSEGKIFDYNGSLYYYPKHAQLYHFTPYSYSYDGVCTNSMLTDRVFVKLLPNDPSITGITSYPFPDPITIEGMVEDIIVE